MNANIGREKSDFVLVIGASGLDVVGRLQNHLQMGTSNPSLIRTSFGGVARNVAENLSLLGQPVILLSAVGKDRIGEDVITHTRQAGVDVSAVYSTDKFPTGFYMGVINKDGAREFAFDDMRIMEELTDGYLVYNEELFEKAGLIFLDANLSELTIRKTFELANKYQIPVCADPTSGTLAEKLTPYLNQIKLMVPNSVEAGILTHKKFKPNDQDASLEAARTLVNLGVDIAIITLSEFGVCYATSDVNGHIPAIRTKVGDPTGAGDALSAAVIYALMNEIDIDDAAKLGISAASLTLRYPGTVDPGLTLERLYDELAA